MICPYCSHTDRFIEVPDYTQQPHLLGECRNCENRVFAVGTQRETEESRQATVREGERQEEFYVDYIVETFGGHDHEDRGKFSHIDRRVVDETGEVDYFLEFKERGCSMNGYQETKFPYNKIQKGKELTEETGKPVYIFLKFIDGWGYIEIDPGKEYKKGSEPFKPDYRGEEAATEEQLPVLIDIHEFEVLETQKDCFTTEELVEYFVEPVLP